MQEVPYDDRDGVIWMDGAFMPWRDAKVHYLSHALHYASCVFEGMRAYNGQIFELTAHNQRLHDSAAMLGFDCLLYTSPSPRDLSTSRMPSSA